MEERMSKALQIATFFSLGSSLIMSLTLFFYAVFNDYVFYELDAIATNLSSSGVIQSTVLPYIQVYFDGVAGVLQYVDYFWLLSFVALVTELLYASYMSRKISGFNGYALLSYGIMFLLFATTYCLRLANWFFDLIVNRVILNMNVTTTFFTFYLQYNLIINAILIALAVVLNFVDFGTIKNDSRKLDEIKYIEGMSAYEERSFEGNPEIKPNTTKKYF